jgi:antitoxin (DNA-binding transcriptional repressor) of toxin-antitoxin stability system
MATFNIHEAKTHLSRLIDRAEKGEEIVIARAGKPVVRLERITPVGRRTPGVDKGRVVIHPDFDDPLPEFDPDYAHPEDPLLDPRQ